MANCILKRYFFHLLRKRKSDDHVYLFKKRQWNNSSDTSNILPYVLSLNSHYECHESVGKKYVRLYQDEQTQK